MRIDLEDETERVFDVNHLVWFLVRVILSDRHPLLPTVRHDLLHQGFDVRILNAEVKSSRFPILELFRFFIILDSREPVWRSV